MPSTDAFHPNLYHVRAAELDGGTAQTPGMQRRAAIIFFDEQTGAETRLRPEPGDYVFVPAYTPHREENNDSDSEALVIIARSTQEAIVVNLPSLNGAELDGPR